MKRTLSILIAAMLLIGLAAGCSNDSPSATPGASSTPTPSSDDSDAATPADADELPEWRITTFHDNLLDGVPRSSDYSEIGQVIKDKFNIVFDYVPYVGDREEKQRLMAVAGDYPEIINIQGEAIFQLYLEANAVVQIDPYLDNMPNFKKRYEESIPYWRLSDPTGEGRLFKYERALPMDGTIEVYIFDIFVRADALEKQGWPELFSTQSYIDFFKQALIDFPETNGQKTLGLCAAWSTGWAPITVGNFYSYGDRFTWGNPWKATLFDIARQTWIPIYDVDEFKEGTNFFNRMYREGLLDPESFTDDDDRVTEKVNDGRALGVWYGLWSTTEANNANLEAGNNGALYIHMPVQLDSQVDRGSKRLFPVSAQRAYDSVTTTIACQDPERWFQFVDWCTTDEAQRLFRSGIEGKHWEYVDGVPTMTDEFRARESDTEWLFQTGLYDDWVTWILPWSRSRDADGHPFDARIIGAPQYPLYPFEVEAYQNYPADINRIQDFWSKNGTVYSNDLLLACNPNAEMDDFDEINAKLIDFGEKNLLRMIRDCKSDDEFNAQWEEFRTTFNEMGVDKIVDAMNRQYPEIAEKLEAMKRIG